MNDSTIRPGIVTAAGETIYPTGDEWLLAFALRGCQWAIDAWEQRVLRAETEWLNSMREGAST